MKRLFVSLLLLTACSSTDNAPLVRAAHIDMPAEAVAVQGANPRTVNASLSFGPWSTTAVNEGATLAWLADSGILQLGRTDQSYRMILQGTTGVTNIECHAGELVAGSGGVFVEASLGQSPILVCGFERVGLRSILAITRSGKVNPTLAGELRQIGGTTYEVRSINRASQSTVTSPEPFGFEIGRDERAFALIETVNRGRVWISPDAPNREDLAAAAAALLLFRDPDAGHVD